MTESSFIESWTELCDRGNSTALEEAWLARLEEGFGDDAGELLEALRLLRSAGKKTLAGTLLELAADEALAEEAWRPAMEILRDLLRLGIGDGERWRAELERCIRQVWADRPSLDAVLAMHSPTSARKPVDAADQAVAWLEHDVGQVFAMAGRGPGRVAEVNLELGVLRLDFEKSKGVPVPIAAAPKHLTPLHEGHFLRRRLEDPVGVAQLVAEDPRGAIGALLQSTGAAMTVTEIKEALDGLVPASGWTSWWTKAKKHPQLIAVGKGTRVQYRLSAAGAVEDEIRAEFDAGRLAERVDVARRHGGRDRELGAYMAGELLRGAAGEATPEVAWEALLVAARLGGDADEVAAVRRRLVTERDPADLLAAVTDAQQRESLLEAVEADVEDWPAVLGGWLDKETHPRLLARVASALAAGGHTARLNAFVDQVLLHPLRYPAALVWLCEPHADPAVTAVVDERLGGALLVRLVELAERPEFQALRPRLREVLSARGLAGTVVKGRLSQEQARRLLQILERPGELAEERDWLKRAIGAGFAELREAPADEGIPMLPGTLARLQKELRDLVERQIPETLKAIQVAREHGDLRENFEYHAARARQEFLSARAAQLQEDLSRVKLVDPATVDLSQVRVGTRAVLRREDGDGERTVTVLGPYEGDPEAGIVAHASEVGEAVLGRREGDVVTVEGVPWRVAAIERVEDPGGAR